MADSGNTPEAAAAFYSTPNQNQPQQAQQPDPILRKVGKALGDAALGFMGQRAQQTAEGQRFYAERALKHLEDFGESGSSMLYNPAFEKELKQSLGPDYKIHLDIARQRAEQVKTHQQWQDNIAKAASFLGQQQQAGQSLGTRQVPTAGSGTERVNPISTVVTAAQQAGMEKPGLAGTGLQTKPEKVDYGVERNAAAAELGFPSFEKAPRKVQAQINAQVRQDKINAAGQQATARGQANLDIQSSPEFLDAKAKLSQVEADAKKTPEQKAKAQQDLLKVVNKNFDDNYEGGFKDWAEGLFGPNKKIAARQYYAASQGIDPKTGAMSAKRAKLKDGRLGYAVHNSDGTADFYPDPAKPAAPTAAPAATPTPRVLAK